MPEGKLEPIVICNIPTGRFVIETKDRAFKFALTALSNGAMQIAKKTYGQQYNKLIIRQDFKDCIFVHGGRKTTDITYFYRIIETDTYIQLFRSSDAQIVKKTLPLLFDFDIVKRISKFDLTGVEIFAEKDVIHNKTIVKQKSLRVPLNESL